MILVLDCNVLISAGWKDGVPRTAMLRAIGRDTVIVCPAILAEYEEVMSRPHLAHVRPELTKLYADLMEVAQQVVPSTGPVGLPDPTDEIYVAAAVAGGAEAILTGNLKHYPADRLPAGLRTLTPRQYLDFSDCH